MNHERSIFTDMKKIIALLLAFMLSITILGACEVNKVPGPTENPTNQTTQAVTEEAKEAKHDDDEDPNATPAEAFEFANGVITKYIGEYDIVRIPKKIDGTKVVAIGEGAFEKNEIITEVYLSADIETIGSRAFLMAKNLKKVDLGNVVTIGDRAFWYAIPESVRLPDSCKTVGTSAFRCATLAAVNPAGELYIPAGVQSIGENAFSADWFKQVVIEGEIFPEFGKYSLLSSLGKVVFYVSDSITEAKAPAVMEKLYGAGIQSAKVLHMDGTPMYIDYSADFDFNKDTGTLRKYIGSSDTCVIPATIGGVPVVAISDNMFNSNENIRIVVIPEGIESIGDGAFYGCTNLESVNIPDSVTKIGTQLFIDTKNLKTIVWPQGVDIPGNTFARSGLEAVAIPGGVKSIGEEAFKNCENLKEVYIADSVTEMGKGVFEACDALEVIDFLPSGLKEIPEDAFIFCKGIREIHIPEGVTHIGSTAFNGCGSRELSSDEWAEIGDIYFVYVEDPEKELGGNWVKDDRIPHIVNVYLSSTVEYIGWAAFSQVRIGNLYLPKGMREVSQLPEFDRCFSGLRYIRRIVLDDDTTEAQMNAMDEFFMTIEEVGDACWYDEGKNLYYSKAEIK